MTDAILQVFDDKRFRIAAAICGALLLIFSMSLLALSSRPMHKASTMVVSVLPDVPYKLPILRSLPEPQPMLPKASRASHTRAAQSPMLARRR